jgi:sugar lactone lactonase YvrE
VAQAKHNPLEIAYTISENDLIPEGIAYDPARKNFYVSSTFKRKIIRIDANGRATDFTQEAQDGLFRWGRRQAKAFKCQYQCGYACERTHPHDLRHEQ